MSSRFPWSTAVVTLATSSIALGVVPRASAQSVTALNGSYSGTYRCGQSVTNLALTITVTPLGEVSARATIAPSTGPRGQSYSYRLTGQYDARTAKFQLEPVAWETPRPDNVGMVGLNGTFDSNELTGAAIGTGCGAFQVERDRAEPTRVAAPQTRPPAPSPATPGPRPTARAANPQPATATGRTFCHTEIDRPVVYVSNVIDTGLTHDIVDIVTTELEELLRFGELEVDFALFLNDRFGRPLPPPNAATGEPIGGRAAECMEGYDLSASHVQQERAAWIAAQRTAGKRLVETGWTPAPTALLPPAPPRGVAPQPATTPPGARRSSSPATSGIPDTANSPRTALLLGRKVTRSTGGRWLFDDGSEAFRDNGLPVPDTFFDVQQKQGGTITPGDSDRLAAVLMDLVAVLKQTDVRVNLTPFAEWGDHGRLCFAWGGNIRCANISGLDLDAPTFTESGVLFHCRGTGGCAFIAAPWTTRSDSARIRLDGRDWTLSTPQGSLFVSHLPNRQAGQTLAARLRELDEIVAKYRDIAR
jgi:hypothetical protein